MKSLVLAGLALPLLAAADCGSLQQLGGHEGQVLPIAISAPAEPARGISLVLLAGGHGHVGLDATGCATQLKGNALLRARPLFQARGYEVVTLDAPADYRGDEGLAGFRIEPAHAEDIGRVVRWLRGQGAREVWLLGTSRGSISAVNAAARLAGEAAPDGLVLSSVLSVGASVTARRSWARQHVFDLPLERIRQPTLLLGHVDDSCPRSPPSGQARVAQRIGAAARTQLISGGAGPVSGPDACEGRSPHGFWGQDAEMVDATLAFIESRQR
ncbi:alpha/beta hydrolase [Mitsuaria sp. WAJ17]|uniref:alpha/beta hydrolase n=1 Tax=Mitsuaria sp. WAJ17 TaxID=2761452 RepID=UPI001601E01B|nr:alpha/beta hydrolase [Mitsuaria sp. WAJ17]MBB2483790.1 alpha/beta hydrolase [Mitsuaria sp. WAJ17]